MKSLLTNSIMLICRLAFFPLIMSGTVVAQTHEAHTHGEGHLFVVYDSGRLLLELETPAANILGFEHEPQNDKQRKALAKAVALLDKPEEVFVVSPQTCTTSSKKVVAPFHDEQNETHHDGSDHHKGEHAHHDNHHDEHKNHHHDDHHDEHDKGHHEGHADFKVAYEWQCDKAKEITIQTKVFEKFAGFEKVRAQWIAFGGQDAKILNAKNTTLVIAP